MQQAYWKYEDIIDLEFFLQAQRTVPEHELHQRDRAIFLNRPSQKATESESADLIYEWLRSRRAELHNAERTPGPIIVTSLKMISFLFATASLIFGFISGFTFFSYSGTTPVNVFHFLFLFVFPQLLLLCALPVTIAFNKMRHTPDLLGGNRKYLSVILAYGAERLAKQRDKSFGAEHQLVFRRNLGLLNVVRQKYAAIATWPFFNLLQKSMISLNSGLLLASVLKISTSDLAFGWQSTIQVGAAGIHNILKLLAVPWSWLVPAEYAHPSLSAIEGSRIILKDGIYHLSTQDLVSWWPFLILCLFCYGLLSRLLLLGFGSLMELRALKHLRLDTPDVQDIRRRMETPIITTQAKPLSARESDDTEHRAVDENLSSKRDSVLLFVSEDIHARLQRFDYEHYLSTIGFSVVSGPHILLQPLTDEIFASFHSGQPVQNPAIFLMLESWMPPIGETLTMLEGMRQKIGMKGVIHIGLIGKPAYHSGWSDVSVQDKTIWVDRISSIGDPYIVVLELPAYKGETSDP